MPSVIVKALQTDGQIIPMRVTAGTTIKVSGAVRSQFIAEEVSEQDEGGEGQAGEVGGCWHLTEAITANGGVQGNVGRTSPRNKDVAARADWKRAKKTHNAGERPG